VRIVSSHESPEQRCGLRSEPPLLSTWLFQRNARFLSDSCCVHPMLQTVPSDAQTASTLQLPPLSCGHWYSPVDGPAGPCSSFPRSINQRRNWSFSMLGSRGSSRYIWSCSSYCSIDAMTVSPCARTTGRLFGSDRPPELGADGGPSLPFRLGLAHPYRVAQKERIGAGLSDSKPRPDARRLAVTFGRARSRPFDRCEPNSRPSE
jgi:hypothetical protein